MQKKKAVLLINLGTPGHLNPQDIKQFLTDFLMDENVMDFSYLLRLLLVKGIIVPSRAAHALQAYKTIWTAEGSPLLVHSENLKKQLQDLTTLPVALSMRYGMPSIQSAFQQLLKKEPDLDEVVVVPLYPHHTMSSYGTAVEKTSEIHNKEKYPFTLRFINPFYNNPDYIATLAESIRPYLNETYDKLLFSYHGIPERHLRKDKEKLRKNKNIFTAPPINYQQQAIETSKLVAAYLQIPQEKFEVTFQSRLAAAGMQWIKPYTADRFVNLPGEGVKKLLVVCPAFVADCLETLEEIGIEGKQTFMKSGGSEFTLIPCLNGSKQFAANILKWVEGSESADDQSFDKSLSQKGNLFAEFTTS